MDLRAVLFVPALAGSVICGFVFLLFAANYYLTVMESTGVGAKEVTWFSEPILDNAWKLGYLAWLIGLWLGPAYFIGRAATSGMDSVWWKLAVPIAFFWLCYPISQLSSLSATSIWYPLVPDVFARLVQRPVVTFGFLLLSIPILAAFAVGFKWAFLTEDAWRLLFAGAPLMVIAGLMYARLIGRLAFALKFTKSLFSEKRKKKPSLSVAASAEEKTEEVFNQPSELPPINTPYDGELSGYDVKLEDDPLPRPKKRFKAEVVESEPELEKESSKDPDFKVERKRRRRPPRSGEIERSRVWTDEDDDSTPYDVREAEGMAIERDEKEKVEKIEKHRVEEELKLLRRDDVPKKPKVIWGLELFVFFAQSGTISAIVIASGLCFLAGTMVRVARMFNPVAGAGPD
jgi:hypothetical protein